MSHTLAPRENFQDEKVSLVIVGIRAGSRRNLIFIKRYNRRRNYWVFKADQAGMKQGAVGTRKGGRILEVPCWAVEGCYGEWDSRDVLTHDIDAQVKEVEDLKMREALPKRIESGHGKPPKGERGQS